jgi:nucleotide-binding universal stress UspA family protein
MMRILVATDGLSHSDLAVKFASRIMQYANGELTILTVLKHRDLNRKAESVFRRAEELLEAERSYVVRNLIRRGNPAKEIAREANEGRYDLVVLGWTPVLGYLRLLRPTVERVISRVACPVAIAKSNGNPIERILICDSGAQEKPVLMRFKEHLADLLNCNPDVAVLHVMSQISAGRKSLGWQLEASAKELIEAHTPEGDLLERDIEMMEKMSLHPQPIIRHGLVVDEILAEARKGDYDLVVIGAHASIGTLDLLLDDIAHQVVSHIDRTILVVK